MSALAVARQQAAVAIRRSAKALPAAAAERFSSMVRKTSPQRLDRLMGSPVGRVILEAIFWQMPRQLDRRRAVGTSTSVRWEITRSGDGAAAIYQLELDDGHCHVTRGETDQEPRVTITLDGAQFLRVATGIEDPMRAYFSGQIKVAGDIMAAAKLGSLFVIPGA